MNHLPFQTRGRFGLAVALVTLVVLVPVPRASAQTAARDHAHGGPFVIEYYYKAKWGFASEFIRLFRKNYYPVLREMKRQGRILSITAHAPRHHATEDGRWDYRVTIVWRDAVTAHEDHHPDEIIRRLFPDQEAYRREEQRRFEILLGHWDVLVEERELESPPAP
jgi:hypothetical protein